MAFLDKVQQAAKVVGEKAGDAVEITKIEATILGEIFRSSVSTTTKSILQVQCLMLKQKKSAETSQQTSQTSKVTKQKSRE